MPQKKSRSNTKDAQSTCLRRLLGAVFRFSVSLGLGEISPRYSLTPADGKKKSTLPCGFRAENRRSPRDPWSFSSPLGPVICNIPLIFKALMPKGQLLTSIPLGSRKIPGLLPDLISLPPPPPSMAGIYLEIELMLSATGA